MEFGRQYSIENAPNIDLNILDRNHSGQKEVWAAFVGVA